MESETTKIEQTLKRAEKSIRHFFKNSPQHTYTEKDIYQVFHAERDQWEIAKWAGPARLLEFVVSNNILTEVRLSSEDYRPKRRYIVPSATEYEIALSIAKGAYFTHATAIFLHALSDQIPKTLYVNREQTPKPKPSMELTQDRLNLAFSRNQRMSKYVFRYESTRIVVLSGKYSDRYGVVEVNGPSGEQLDTTSIARTLVDIAVRPGYAGGIFQVLDAYRGALGKVSGDEILQSLEKLDYVYPYHQSIGFLLEKAGFSEQDLSPFRTVTNEFDFHLIHGLREKEYDNTWRLFYPKGL